MAASHYAYNVLKMPGPLGVITIHSDKMDTLICADQLCQEAVAAPAVKASAPAVKASAPAAGTPGGTKKTGKNKKSKAAPPETKKVPVREDGTGGTFTISSTLDDK
jgi:hypothetical protein